MTSNLYGSWGQERSHGSLNAGGKDTCIDTSRLFISLEKALHYKNNMSCNAAPADARLMLVVPYVP
jgi:hypothetical protein